MKMLAEEYRPKSLNEIVGQQNIKRLVLSWIRTDRVPRSILIHGDLSSCKTSLSRIIAATLLCTDPKEHEPCRACRSCLAVQGDCHPDYVEINAASDRGIDAMRALAQKVVMKPLLNKRRIIVLDECHGLTPQSWEALLKVLEEPPEHVVWMLITTAPDKLRPTVISRCSQLRMGALSSDEVVELLAQIVKSIGLGKAGITEKHLTAIAHRAQAHARNALHILDQVYTLVLDAQGTGSAVDEAMVNSFIDTVATPTTAAQAATISRAILEGQPGAALKLISNLPGEGEALLRNIVTVMCEAMHYSIHPKLAKPYFHPVFEGLRIMEPGHRQVVLDAYKAILTAYTCSTAQFVPALELLCEATARAALLCKGTLRADTPAA